MLKTQIILTRYKGLKKENNQGIETKQLRKFTFPLVSTYVYYLVERKVNKKGWGHFRKENVDIIILYKNINCTQ